MIEADIEWQWRQYLKRVELDERTMSPQQRTELRRAFYGAVGQMLAFITFQLPKLTDEQGLIVLEGMFSQVATFWDKEVNRHNSKNN